ncbi:hypothetical protein IGI04_025796 [Brassica rapa subsp. trilocularis]|uniref:Symplekin C-terminal domain-containing protein n=1 Tax=Brassica rapa subsp. trilocularis TaxID=1813537 RepID=A0ABQ7KXA4_BRACM|nr:hypothetical protein IGI04_025796 [Brassica rapa subsp. trilocularis]
MHFMLEDFPQRLQEVFRSLYPKLLRRLLKDFWKTLGRLPGRLSTKSSGSLLKSSAQSGTKE